ncbi:MAG: SDR family oxidoreductase [Pseudomonadota bacterium]
MHFEGKTILVTAAAQGMGRDAAEALLEAGAHVIATDVNAATLTTLTDHPRRQIAQLDVTDATAVQDLIDRLDRLDGLFNCAGIVHSGTIETAREGDWGLAFDVNVRGPARCIQAALPLLLAAKTASIVNMASVVSSVVGAPERCVYGTTKAAVIGLTKSVAKDYVAKGLRCNAICPGTVHTPSLDERLEASGDYDAALKAFTERQPMGRLADASEITPLILYLLSDASRFITGQAISIDGGWSA